MVPTRKIPAGCDEPPREGEETMHPALVSWWHAQRAGFPGGWSSCGPGGAWAGSCGPGSGRGEDGFEGGGGGDWGDGGGGGGFGVRRPLRFLAYKLELDEKQVSE